MNFRQIAFYATLASVGLATIAPSASFCTRSEWCELPAFEPVHNHQYEPGLVITSTGALTVAVSTAATGGTFYYVGV